MYFFYKILQGSILALLILSCAGMVKQCMNTVEESKASRPQWVETPEGDLGEAGPESLSVTGAVTDRRYADPKDCFTFRSQSSELKVLAYSMHGEPLPSFYGGTEPNTQFTEKGELTLTGVRFALHT